MVSTTKPKLRKSLNANRGAAQVIQMWEKRRDKQRWQLTANHRPNTDGAAFYPKRFIWVCLDARREYRNEFNFYLFKTILHSFDTQSKQQRRIVLFILTSWLNWINESWFCYYCDFRTKFAATRSALYCMLIKIRISYSNHALLCIHTNL